MDDALEYIEKHAVDRRAFRKRVRKRFKSYETPLGLRKRKDKLKQYNDDAKLAMDIIFRTIENDITYQTRNLYFIFAIIDTHFEYYKDVIKKLSTLDDDFMKDMVYESLFQKNKDFIEVLKNNEKEPVTAEQLQEVMEKNKNAD